MKNVSALLLFSIEKLVENIRFIGFLSYIRIVEMTVSNLLLGLLSLLFVSGIKAMRTEEICKGDMDIRNSIDSFKKLENCTVIEGNLQILLIDYAQADDYERLHFPNLVEITGYFLLYRVFHLRTLRKMFPNLSVIRGNNLFFNYGLVIFEMMHLQEIGLVGFTNIQRGFVRIEKNPDLCYIDTIDWKSIAKDAHEDDHFIMGNRKQDECANSCPNISVCPSLRDSDQPSSLCWTSQDCQKGNDPNWNLPSSLVCPQSCESKLCNNGICCHKECLGGCRGTKSEHCFVCKHVFFQGRCLESCPASTFKFFDRRCITEQECIKMGQNGKKKINWKVYNQTCIDECPPKYTEDENNPHKCKECNKSCPKVCNGITIDSVSTAQSVRGCTIIDGQLEIDIRGGKKIAQELEENLKQIEEVRYYVKIARSYPVMSLNFLQNLKIIRGEKLFTDTYSLYILNNENLHELWEPGHKLQILNGKIFFHFNPKLCYIKIKQLITELNMTETVDERDVSPRSNGDQVACSVQKLIANISKIAHNNIIIKWNSFKTEDPRSLLGYVVGYREAPEKNVTLYGGRDACGSDDWKIMDIASNSDDEMSEFIPDLKPWTQYAFFVQTYTIASELKGAQSSIMYFTTLPTTPSLPNDVTARSNSSSELIISWKPPTNPNGNVTHYYVYWQIQSEDPSLFDLRNYCLEPLKPIPASRKEEIQKAEQEKTKTNQTIDGKCCECPKDDKQKKFEEHQVLYQIMFENFLHNYVYIKRPVISSNIPDSTPASTGDIPNPNRRRRHMVTINASLINQTATNETDRNVTTPTKESQDYFATTVYHKTRVVLKNLQHFSEYSIEVIACHEEGVKNGTKLCSNQAITVARTLPLNTADNINMSSIQIDYHANQTGAVILKWNDPPNPNGLIIIYEIEYKKLNVENFKPNSICIPYKDFKRTKSYLLKDLSPGNYSFQLRAISLAGNGSWTDSLYFNIQDYEVSNNGAINTETLIAFSTVGAILLIIIVAVTVWYIAKKKLGDGKLPNGILYASVNPEYMSAADVYVPDEWEAPREKIKVLRELGQGSFGMVYEGEARDLIPNKHIMRCAVKTVNESASIRERIEFLNEASVMKAFNCYHVVKLLGVVSKGQPTLVVMELMARGDLKSYLRSHRPDEQNGNAQPPSLKQILQMAGEIADGMAYLAAKKFVHRDLAARNCMVAEDLTVKIGDFGMTRDIYETDYYRKGGKGLLPVRWMAPESLKDGVFTSLSDVWSYGVVLWEMATLASQPYQGLSNEQVLKYVIDGGIMDKPGNCPDKLYELMKLCWQHSHKARPTFLELIEILLSDLNENFRQNSFYFSQERNRPDVIEIEIDDINPEVEAVRPLTQPDEASLDSDYNDLSSEEEGLPASKEGETGLSNPESGTHSNEGSKGLSINSSEGSKDSKVSGQSIANGSIGNGHLHLQSPKCTEC